MRKSTTTTIARMRRASRTARTMVAVLAPLLSSLSVPGSGLWWSISISSSRSRPSRSLKQDVDLTSPPPPSLPDDGGGLPPVQEVARLLHLGECRQEEQTLTIPRGAACFSTEMWSHTNVEVTFLAMTSQLTGLLSAFHLHQSPTAGDVLAA